MPIQLEQPIKALSEQEFHDLDFQVMRLAFDAHNRLGRFYDEKIYQNELLNLCRDNGISAETEVKIGLTHKSFTKDLFIDLLIENGSVYELKTANSIVSDYRIQTLDYLLLSNIRHGKIIIFRPPSVEHEFVSTSLAPSDRRNISILEESWHHGSETADKLKSIASDLFDDWGAFLDSKLYKEAICHFFGGQEEISVPIEILKNGCSIGTQKIPLFSSTETFCISSVKIDVSGYQNHLQRFLNCTPLKSLFWINLNRSEVQFRTLRSKLFCP